MVTEKTYSYVCGGTVSARTLYKVGFRQAVVQFSGGSQMPKRVVPTFVTSNATLQQAIEESESFNKTVFLHHSRQVVGNESPIIYEKVNENALSQHGIPHSLLDAAAFVERYGNEIVKLMKAGEAGQPPATPLPEPAEEVAPAPTERAAEPAEEVAEPNETVAPAEGEKRVVRGITTLQKAKEYLNKELHVKYTDMKDRGSILKAAADKLVHFIDLEEE